MFNLFRVASSTFKESIREPVYCLLLVCAAVLIAHFPAISLFVFYGGKDRKRKTSRRTCLFFFQRNSPVVSEIWLCQVK